MWIDSTNCGHGAKSREMGLLPNVCHERGKQTKFIRTNWVNDSLGNDLYSKVAMLSLSLLLGQ